MPARESWLLVRALVALAALAATTNAQECATVSGVRTLDFTASTGVGFSHAMPGATTGDMLFARKPTAADLRREAFLARGAGELLAVSAEPDAQLQLPDLILERGQRHTVLWPLNGTCALKAYEAVFALVPTAGFFVRDADAQTTAVLVPNTFNQASLQYTCADAALGAKPGTIYVAQAPTARVLTTASTPASAVQLRATHAAATAYPESLVLHVEPGYAGAGGAGFAQRVGTAGAWAAQTEVRARLVAGSAQPTPAHMALLLTRGELRTDADWSGLVCGTPAAAGATHASYDVCRGGGGAPSHAQVVDGLVVPLWRDDCCSLLQPRAAVASVSGGGLVATATLGTGAGALWAYPALAQTRRLCTPGADTATQVFPCRWPDALASPWPTDDGTAGPYFFDQVLVPERGWVLVCVGGGAKIAHAAGLQAAPNAPADAYAFTAGAFVHGDTGPRGACAHTCPAGDTYTNVRGELAWTPAVPAGEDAAQQLWLYAVFMLGDSDACLQHACDASALDAHGPAYLATERAVHALTLFPGTELDLVAPQSGTRRRVALGAPKTVPRATALQRLRALALRPRFVHLPGGVAPLPANVRRRLLAVASDAPRAEGAVAAREVLGVDPLDMIEHAVCRVSKGTECRALRADFDAGTRERYCRPETEIIAELQPVFARAIPRYQVMVTGVERPQFDALCVQAGPGRLLLQDQAAIYEQSAKLVVSSTGEIKGIYFLESVLKDKGINSIKAEEGRSLRSVVRSCATVSDFTNTDCGMVPETKSEEWPWGISALIVFAAVLIAGMAVFLVTLRCRAAQRAPSGPCAPEENTLLPPPQMQYALPPPMQYAPPPMQYAPPQMHCAPPRVQPYPPRSAYMQMPH